MARLFKSKANGYRQFHPKAGQFISFPTEIKLEITRTGNGGIENQGEAESFSTLTRLKSDPIQMVSMLFLSIRPWRAMFLKVRIEVFAVQFVLSSSFFYFVHRKP